MPSLNDRFLMSTELECLTALPGQPAGVDRAIERFLQVHARLAPHLPGGVGFFNPYGRVYKDVGEGAHLEFSAMECDSPYLLAQVVETQQQLAAQAVGQLHDEKLPLLLANNNHDGLLQSGCAVWGAHENYLVEEHPRTFGERILPFLVTRIYGGAGGVHYPSGRFLACVRTLAMQYATGGGTTSQRAIHSTARDENLVGPHPHAFRYHLILGDGHRCQFNLAVQFGATALAVKAALFDPELPARLKEIRAFHQPDWVALLNEVNVLAEPGGALSIHPLVLETQRLYLEAARRYLDRLGEGPVEPRMWLADWQATLDAFERMDRRWLSSRLDAFAKYECYSAVLHEAGSSWQDLPARRDLFHELALLDHSYHEFCSPQSLFRKLEDAGLLDHRVKPPLPAGTEPDPFIPDTRTRARARARFLRDHNAAPDLRMDWSCVNNQRTGESRHILDPFAEDYTPPSNPLRPTQSPSSLLASAARLLGQ
jgi:hypothetical protein